MREYSQSDEYAVAAEIFRLLADPTRVALLHVLADTAGASRGERSVNQLAEAVQRRQSAVSQHLARLRMARMVTTQRNGNQVFYRLANEHVRQLVIDALQQAEHLGTGVPAHHTTGPDA